MKIRKGRFLIAAAVVLLHVLPNRMIAAPPVVSTPSAPRPTTASALCDLSTPTLLIRGVHLVDDSSVAPFVFLGELPSLGTALDLLSWDRTTILAVLPNCDPGSYSLTIRHGKGEGSMDVTLGEVGPTGPEGEDGRDGLPGPQGPQGEVGPMGPAGTDGATIPAGFSILGVTANSPPQFAFTGMTVWADLPADTWIARASMPTPRLATASAAANGKIYVIGGGNPGLVSTNEEYDPVTNTWVGKASLPSPRADLGADSVGGKIYVVGGNGPSGVQATNFEYDPVTNTWATKQSMNSPRAFLDVGSVGGKLYAIGGYPDQATNEEYDPATNTWITRAPLLGTRAYHSVAVARGKIYVVGGARNSSFSAGVVTEEYDPATNTWATKAPMPIAITASGADTIANQVHVIVGFNQSVGGMLASHHVYDPASDSWSTRRPGSPRRSFSVVAAEDVLFVIGGNRQYPGTEVIGTNEEYGRLREKLFVHRKD